MGLLVKADLYSHIYQEVIEEIVRNTDDADTKLAMAIKAGEAEAKAYLNRFDMPTMFTTEYEDELLRNKVKDIVCWHLIRLANPNIDMALFRTLYEDAIRFFEKVMKGLIDPAGWPLRADDPDTPNDDAGNVEWRTFTKRTNNF